MMVPKNYDIFSSNKYEQKCHHQKSTQFGLNNYSTIHRI